MGVLVARIWVSAILSWASVVGANYARHCPQLRPGCQWLYQRPVCCLFPFHRIDVVYCRQESVLK